MNADAELDALLLRDAGVALDHRALDLDGAAHRVNNAAEFDDASVAGALDDAAAMHGDDRVDEVAAERPEASEDPILIRASETAEADNVGHLDRRKFAGLGHGPSCHGAQREQICHSPGDPAAAVWMPAVSRA
jgi:hypothetical protein